MKQKDIMMIVVVGLVAGVFSLVLSRVLFVKADNRQQAVEDVPVISTAFTQPSSKYFNPNSIDPTLTIQIGTSTNPAPFKASN